MPTLHPDLLDISTHSSQSENMTEEPQNQLGIGQVIKGLRENPVDLFESIKDMEKSHAM